jgi:hypothetical protein
MKGVIMDQAQPGGGALDAANRVVELEAELEASGTTATEGDKLEFARSALRDWVETVVAVVSSPGVGRVTLIHANGSETKIASPELPYLVTPPVAWGRD